MQRRECALAPSTAAFEAAVPGRIRGDERFQQALQSAETAESLERAIARHEGELKQWAAKAGALLIAIRAADGAYDQELRRALDAYRNSITEDSAENGIDGTHAH